MLSRRKHTKIRLKHVVLFLTVLVLSSCVTPRYNKPLEDKNKKTVSVMNEDDSSLLMFVALSGGGTRAAAMSWEALKYLKSIDYHYKKNGKTVKSNLADQIDYISGISGGSFAAAAWCIYRNNMKEFDRRFVEKNIQCELAKKAFLSPCIFKMISPYYDRINVASEYYDEEVFKGKKFKDLPAYPVLLVNATHLALGLRFTFTEKYFKMLSSDLGEYPVGYSCAASSAFPILLDPITLKNYGRQLSEKELMKNLKYRTASENAVNNVEDYYYCKTIRFFNNKKNKWHHLADGGIVDNQGLQAILDEFKTNGVINKAVNNKKIKRLIIINVNAGTEKKDNSCTDQSSPGAGNVISYTMSLSMDRLSAKRWMEIKSRCDILNKARLKGLLDIEKPYCIEVNFRNITDRKKRKKALNLPTSFNLKKEELRLIREVTPELLNQNKDMKRLKNKLI